MSVSLIVDGALWGLIACHHYNGPKFVPHRERATCEFIGIAASSQLSIRAALARSTAREAQAMLRSQLLQSMAAADSISDGLEDAGQALLDLTGAYGAVVVLGQRVVRVGATPSDSALQALAARIAASDDGHYMSVSWCAELGLDEDESVAGTLAISLARRQGNFIAWFRPAQSRTVTWAGRPEKVVNEGGMPSLSPRASFAAWVESVSGQSLAWSTDDVESVLDLRAAIGTFLLAHAERLAQLNLELARSNEELDAFAYAAAHDLKEPLRGIHNFAGFLIEDYEDVLDEEGQARLRTLMRLARRMASLLDSLLDYSRVGRADLHPESIAVADVVADVVELLSVPLGQAGAEVSCDSDLTVWADRSALREILLNLISNAIKYSDSPPRITVEARVVSSGDGLVSSDSGAGSTAATEFRVNDNGIGIPSELLIEVFRVFRRLHGRDDYGGGAGAGLTIARRIVEHHGGRIWAESQLGVGSSFAFTIGAPA